MSKPSKDLGTYPYQYHYVHRRSGKAKAEEEDEDEHEDEHEDEDSRPEHQRFSSTTRLTSPRIMFTPPMPVSPEDQLWLPHQSHLDPGSSYLLKEGNMVPRSGDEGGESSTAHRVTSSSSPQPPSVSFRETERRTPDLDSLLESPLRINFGSKRSDAPPPGQFTKSHRPTNSDGVSDVSNIIGPSSPGGYEERRKRIATAVGEAAFKSPIIGSGPKKATMKLEPHEVIDQRAEMTAVWGIHWYLPSVMAGVFIAGLVGALGHHIFYSTLDGRESENQLSMVRIGTAFAFFVKANLVGAVVLAYRQRIWVDMRESPMKIKVIDALFGVIEDPTFFFTNPQMLKQAKLASLLAAATWLIPIASVLSPSSLTSEISQITLNRMCEVPTLNFSAENAYDYRTATEFFGNSLAFYNLTDPDDQTSDMSYDMPSYINKRLVSQSIFNHGYVGPSWTPCPGYNCTYIMVMHGPGYKCNDVEPSSELSARNPLNVEDLAPGGDFIYLSNVTLGDFEKPNLKPHESDLDPDWIVGTFHYEPELWIGYTINTSVPLTEETSIWKDVVDGKVLNRWTHKLEPKVFHCVHYHVIYTFNISISNGQQSVETKNIEYIRPVVDTTYDLRRDNHPDPEKFVRPGQQGYKLTAIYHAVGALMRAYLVGHIKYPNNRPRTIPITTAGLSMTNLVDPMTASTVPDLRNNVQKFYEDIIITLWSSQILVITANTTVSCTVSRYENRFKYHRANLWVGYSIVVGVTVGALIVGALSLRSNGIVSDSLFSRILVTTRNPTLDKLSRGACLGADPFPQELEQTKLRFGVLRESPQGGKPGHCAFGTIHETTDIVKGGVYAGLGGMDGVLEAGYSGYQTDSQRQVDADQSDEEESLYTFASDSEGTRLLPKRDT
ncbi:hypothetical protein BDZ91DRAFT_711782 [Kalaharituber pfeilii]|nr:hypothetical protein BDZ91DRAFT_711782 [Kalaharituber pfeilii]